MLLPLGAAVIGVLFQPRASLSVHVIGNSGQLPLTYWYSVGARHLTASGCSFGCHSWAGDATVT